MNGRGRNVQWVCSTIYVPILAEGTLARWERDKDFQVLEDSCFWFYFSSFLFGFPLVWPSVLVLLFAPQFPKYPCGTQQLLELRLHAWFLCFLRSVRVVAWSISWGVTRLLNNTVDGRNSLSIVADARRSLSSRHGITATRPPPPTATAVSSREV